MPQVAQLSGRSGLDGNVSPPRVSVTGQRGAALWREASGLDVVQRTGADVVLRV